MFLDRLLLIVAATSSVIALFLAARNRPLSAADSEASSKPVLDALERLRRDVQADLVAQLQSLRDAQSKLERDILSVRSALAADLATSLAKQSGEASAARLEQEKKQIETLAAQYRGLNDSLQKALYDARVEQTSRLDRVQVEVQERLVGLQRSNEERLERMRQTVDEKLHQTLEQRLGESFRHVSERLEEVQRGLGEMRALATDVGGLKRALTNVKTRGVLGEAQLGALLEQFLAPTQFAANVRVKKGSQEHVEFAVKLPGPDEGATVLLPIDAKFPIEDYQRLIDAYELGDAEAVARSAQALETRVLQQAREIRDKYLNPPATTDFAVLFLPFEGLYAEVLRRPGLFERVQRECRVTLVGPTTLTAFLNSLQVGFKTLAITKRSAEVWKVLAVVKTEFRRFGDALDAAQKKVEEAGTKLGEVSKRNDLMQRRLAKVEELPEDASSAALDDGDELGN